MEFKYTSIILSKYDIFETDRIYNFYTLEEGKLCAIGKGVRKINAKLAGNLEPLTQAEIFVSKRKGMGTITGVVPMNNFSALKNNFSAVNCVFFVLSYFDRLISEREKDAQIFGLFLEYLEAIEKNIQKQGAEYKLEIISLGFLFKLAGISGYKIRLKHCANCGQQISGGNGNFFSAERGGTLCSQCGRAEMRKIKNSDSNIKLMRIFLKNKINSFSKLEVSYEDIVDLKLIWHELVGWILG